ncbi:kunitz trypsin inhibitor 2-like [Cynara cardunculus var. scolymus]|uniref:kunitz trypsin inhibitor 2-like n=1 Tax=Cynara cardunculus var. scolymus TaxID=59895 RepID=UPI000D62F4CC|nr:kunitz trypsin inhibitor 2-like [Cynara cardunculus var. scolymus]
MKITLSSLLLNLFVFTTTFSHLSTAAVDVIYDSAGNKLLKGVPYYILPLLRGTGGGLTLSGSINNTCPLSVTQEPFELSYGVPFIITPILFDEEFIRESYPVSVNADIADPCQGSKIWKVTTGAATAKTVTIGGVSNTPESCFQVVENKMMPGLQSYQIQHCPFKCGLNSTTSRSCYNIGVVSDAVGKGFLAPTDVIFPVVFSNSFGTPIQSS